MGKYIEADSLYKDITRSIDYCEDILDIVEKQPAADVAEVRHGRWVDSKCSVCGFDWHDIQYEKTKVNKSPYCPNCGASMDEVEENG